MCSAGTKRNIIEHAVNFINDFHTTPIIFFSLFEKEYKLYFLILPKEYKLYIFLPLTLIEVTDFW